MQLRAISATISEFLLRYFTINYNSENKKGLISPEKGGPGSPAIDIIEFCAILL